LPLYSYVNQKKFAQREIIFHHLVTRGFTKNYTCWNKHGKEGLNELEADCLNEGEVQHHATDHDEDLDDSGLFEENEPLFPLSYGHPWAHYSGGTRTDYSVGPWDYST
jgi:hypothetical protein